MAVRNQRNYLRDDGPTLLRNGYEIVAIHEGQKAPVGKDWLTDKITISSLTSRIARADRHGERHGVGIISAKTPGVDIDSSDPKMVAYMEDYIKFTVGDAPVRIGRAPRRLLMFRSKTPFRKLNSGVWLDQANNEHHIEILAAGQQFVALHVHPDTGQEYKWVNGHSPLTSKVDELPILTEADGRDIINEFATQAAALGWRKKPSTKLLSQGGNIDRDDPFAADVAKAEIEWEDLRDKLMSIPNEGAEMQDYDTYLQVLAGLHHQTDGGDDGLEIAKEWASQAAKYDPTDVERRYASLDISSKGRQPITARFIIALAKEYAKAKAQKELVEIRKAINAANDLAGLREAAGKAKLIEMDRYDREAIVGLVQRRYKAIESSNLPVGAARDMVRFEDKNRPKPKWLEDQIFCEEDETFYDLKRHTSVSRSVFDAANSRHLLTKQDIAEGRSRPEQSPQDVALNTYRIPVVRGKRYMPGEDTLFTMNGHRYVNTYSDRSIPEVPEKPTARDRENLEIVQRHFAHLFPDLRDRALLISWLAYIVRSYNRVNYAVLMVGAEGDGKTTIGRMMGLVLGPENYRTIHAKLVEETHNAWAEGSRLCLVEEVRWRGHNRHDIMNSFKPFITNDVVDIRRMRVDSYNVPNTISYLMTSNHSDALAVADADSRYFIINSRFRMKAEIDAFNVENPTYYVDLNRAIDESPGMIRKWLLDFPLHPEFNPKGRAPRSKAKDIMIMENRPASYDVIADLVESRPRADCCPTLLNATALTDDLLFENEAVPETRTMNAILHSLGFYPLGRFKVDGRKARFWSKTPDKFETDGQIDPDKIREWIKDDL